jgi:hypothetical protein
MTNWSKVGKRSRRKGGTYERKICKLLTETTTVKFRRSPRSGALLRDGRVNGQFISGDLTSESPFAYSIECKNRKILSLDSALKNVYTSPLAESWFQCVYDADIANKLPMLFFYVSSVKKDHIAVTKDGFELLGYSGPYMFIGRFRDTFTFEIEQKEVTRDLPDMYIITTDQFKGINNYTHCFE